MLGQLELEVGIKRGTHTLESAIAGDTVVVEAHRHIGSPLEPLQVLEIRSRGSLVRSCERTGWNEIGVIALERATDDRIEGRDRRTEESTSGRSNNSTSAGARTARAQGRSTST